MDILRKARKFIENFSQVVYHILKFFLLPAGGVLLRWADLSDLDRKVLLEVDQGPQRMATKGSAVFLTIYYCFLFTVGVPGNLLTCLIICTNSYMRTPSNFFLVSLALTDLLSIIYGKW